MNSSSRLKYLLQQYMIGSANVEEAAQLMDLLAEMKYDQEEVLRLLDEKASHSQPDPQYNAEKYVAVIQGILHSKEKPVGMVTSKVDGSKPVKPVSFLRSGWLRYAAAVLIILGAGIYFFTLEKSNPAPSVANTVPVKDIPAPSFSRATLTLADGQQIAVDSVHNGVIAVKGNVRIQRMNDGRIVYKGNNGSTENQYNTLTVPRGSPVTSMVLADGTKVFLNAASSLTYPVAFGDNERRVEITGEAYFEVAKDPLRKFMVTGGGLTTEVLGTHFNINTYGDEEAMKVTLLEGSVNVRSGVFTVLLKLGEQAVLKSGRIKINHSVDLEQVMAWKNGFFNFNNASIETVMGQLARWYDVEVVYPEGIPDIKFGGKIQKDLPLSKMLEALGYLGVKYEINGKKLIVRP